MKTIIALLLARPVDTRDCLMKPPGFLAGRRPRMKGNRK